MWNTPEFFWSNGAQKGNVKGPIELGHDPGPGLDPVLALIKWSVVPSQVVPSLKWFQMVPNGSKWSKMVSNGSKLCSFPMILLSFPLQQSKAPADHWSCPEPRRLYAGVGPSFIGYGLMRSCQRAS